MDKLPNKKLLAVGALYIGGALSVFFILLLSSKLPILSFDNHSQVAQIIAIETDLLRKWQQSKALKNNLAYNSKGSDVALLQRMLSQDTTAYPEKSITGYYGDLTLSAVKKFQREYGLTETGIVDTETRNKLNEIFLSHLCPEPVAIYPEFLMKKVEATSPLPLDYTPPSLVDISNKIKTAGIVCLRQDVAPNLTQMFTDAKQDGVEFMVTSGYRKPEIQQYLYDFWIRVEGDAASDEIAKPGLSEHQLGSTVDLTDASIGFAGGDPRFGTSKGGRWLQQNAHKYGFVISFPKYKKEKTGFRYEPWHWRFVGVETATQLRQQDWTYNEANFDAHGFPVFKKNIGGLILSANSFISVFVSSDGKEKVLLEKNRDGQLPIASITKLMVALIASEQYKPSDIVSISENSLEGKGMSGIYRTGDRFLFSDTLHALLLASHNEIANALAEQKGKNQFLDSMNKKVLELGLSGTAFVNVTGLDPNTGSERINHSTVFDVYKLARYIQENRPDIISITSQKQFSLFDADKNFVATISNINKLLDQHNVPFRIVGGKTGETSRAKQNLAIVTEAPCGGKIFNVVLGSQNRFDDMQKLLWYANDSYQWICSP